MLDAIGHVLVLNSCVWTYWKPYVFIEGGGFFREWDFQGGMRFTFTFKSQNISICLVLNQNVFSIIKTMEYLEVKYANGEIPGSEYDTEWRTLYGQLEMSTNSITNF